MQRKLIKMNKKKHTTNKQHKKKNPKAKRKLWKKILSILIILCAIGIFAVFGFFLYIVSSTGEFDPNALANQDQTIIYDNNDKIIAFTEGQTSWTSDQNIMVLDNAEIKEGVDCSEWYKD